MKVQNLEIMHPWWYFAKLQKMLIFSYHDLEGATCVTSICNWESPSNVALRVMTKFLPSLDLVKSVNWERGSNPVKRDAKVNSWLRAKDCSRSFATDLVDMAESCVNPPCKTPCCPKKSSHMQCSIPLLLLLTQTQSAALQRTDNNAGFMPCISNKS